MRAPASVTLITSSKMASNGCCGHQVGDKGGNAAGGGRGGFLGGVVGHAWPRNVVAVAEMQVGIDDAGKYRQAADLQPLPGRDGRSRREDCRKLTIKNRKVGCEGSGAG